MAEEEKEEKSTEHRHGEESNHLLREWIEGLIPGGAYPFISVYSTAVTGERFEKFVNGELILPGQDSKHTWASSEQEAVEKTKFQFNSFVDSLKLDKRGRLLLYWRDLPELIIHRKGMSLRWSFEHGHEEIAECDYYLFRMRLVISDSPVVPKLEEELLERLSHP